MGRTLMTGPVACSLEAKETLCVHAPKQYIRWCRDETRVRVAAACHAPPLLPSCCQGPMASSSTGTLSQWEELPDELLLRVLKHMMLGRELGLVRVWVCM